MPVLKVLLVTAVGSFLALDYVNILSEDARKHINTIVFYVFNPALIIGNLAKTITYESMVKLWFMPVNVFLTFLIGSLLGWLVNLVTRPPHLRGLVIGCCAAENGQWAYLLDLQSTCRIPCFFLDELTTSRGELKLRSAGRSGHQHQQQFNPEPVLPALSARPDQVERVLKARFKEAMARIQRELDLLIVILPDNKGSLYGDLKRICETDLGIVSQCCLTKHVFRMSKQYLANVALKINVKVCHNYPRIFGFIKEFGR